MLSTIQDPESDKYLAPPFKKILDISEDVLIIAKLETKIDNIEVLQNVLKPSLEEGDANST